MLWLLNSTLVSTPVDTTAALSVTMRSDAQLESPAPFTSRCEIKKKSQAALQTKRDLRLKDLLKTRSYFVGLANLKFTL